jgi:hypothetical protein
MSGSSFTMAMKNNGRELCISLCKSVIWRFGGSTLMLTQIIQMYKYWGKEENTFLLVKRKF